MGSDFAQAVQARRKKDWELLRKLVTSTEAIVGRANIKIEWGATPTRVGSLALAYLAQGAKEDPSTLSTYVLEMVPFLLLNVKSDDKEMSDNALMFMLFTIDYISKVTREEVIGLNGFKYLVTIMGESRSEPRHVAAIICHSLYKNNLNAQKKFLQAGGGQQLVQLLMRESEDEQLVVEIMNFLGDLISITVDGETKVVREHVEVLIKSNVHDILTCLNFDSFKHETFEEMDKLVRLLAE